MAIIPYQHIRTFLIFLSSSMIFIVQIYHNLFNQPPTNGHLWCFQASVTDKTAMNHLGQTFPDMKVKVLEEELLDPLCICNFDTYCQTTLYRVHTNLQIDMNKDAFSHTLTNAVCWQVF